MTGPYIFPCLAPSEILLPSKSVDPSRWAVIACDQYTSQPEYWEDVERIVGDAPSAYRMICPEAFLSAGDRHEEIRASMKRALDEGWLTAPERPGFVLTERTTPSGKRVGLVAALDLDAYDYKSAEAQVRATEQTVEDRLPPRIRIRENALLELPHILLLADDPGKTVLEPLYGRVTAEGRTPAYDFELMKNGGHLRGWRIDDGPDLALLSASLKELERTSGGLLFAVGDGNHSLAAAKSCREKRKASGEGGKDDLFRYALVEVVNLHSPAIRFEPIHRLVTGTDAEELASAFRAFLKSEGLACTKGTEIKFVSGGRTVRETAVRGKGGRLPVQILQPFLDGYVRTHPGCSIDYIHGEQALLSLCASGKGAGILLEPMKKEDLFPGIRAGGCLPRKTFSMGEADEKRFYFECRKLVPGEE